MSHQLWAVVLVLVVPVVEIVLAWCVARRLPTWRSHVRPWVRGHRQR